MTERQDKVNVFAIGCSWTENWPRYVPCDSTCLDGKGIDTFRRTLKGHDDLVKYDTVIVQLPTPIRRGEGYTAAGVAAYVKRVAGVGEKVARMWLLHKYMEDVKAIAALHRDVRFLLLEVGGYPFRKPFDFGEDARRHLIASLPQDLIRLDFGDDKRYWLNENNYHPGVLACEAVAKEVRLCCARC